MAPKSMACVLGSREPLGQSRDGLGQRWEEAAHTAGKRGAEPAHRDKDAVVYRAQEDVSSCAWRTRV